MKSPSYLSSAQGTGRQSLSWQHSCGYQECATAAPLTSINAAASKQTSFGIIDPQSAPTMSRRLLSKQTSFLVYSETDGRRFVHKWPIGNGPDTSSAVFRRCALATGNCPMSAQGQTSVIR